MITVDNMRFRLGQVVATPEAIKCLQVADQQIWDFLSRHAHGDFGEIDAEDRQANEDAIQHGDRILSAYTLRTGQRLYVITEADRSSTCVLRVEDY